MKKIILISLFWCVANMSFAADEPIHPSVHLLSLKAVQTTEKHGDELYLNVTVFHSGGDTEHFQIPTKPSYWPSEHLGKVNNLEMWNGELTKGAAAEIIFSLVEHDVPPWNTDDLLGDVRLHLQNVDGELQSSWSMPNRADAPVTVITKHGKAEKFTLLGEDGNYELYFILKLK